MLKGFEAALKDIESFLDKQMNEREELIKKGREVFSSCSKAIVNVHSGRMKEAREELDRARNMLSTMRGCDASLKRYMIPPEQEYVEAEILFSLANNKHVPLPSELECNPESYLLGLLDAIGELKRLSLTCIMDGDIEGSERHFRSMEMIYLLCSPLAIYDNVLPGTRRKIDVGRMIVEDMRGIITEERSRRRLKSSVEKLSKKLTNRS